MKTPDNYDMWEAHERELENARRKRPMCYKCGEHIQDDCRFNVYGYVLCESCLFTHFREVNDDEELF